MLTGVEYESVVQTRPGVSDRTASLEHEMPDAGAAEFPRRRESSRTGTDDDGVG